MDIQDIERLITPRTKAVIFPYIFGLPSDITSVAELCRKRNLILIEDCAQSFGASFQGKILGTLGDFSVFSFGLSKPIGGIGGGALYCRNTEHLKKVQEQKAQLTDGSISIKMYLELFAASFVFSKYIYPFASLAEQYIVERREQGDESEFSLKIHNLQAKIASVKFQQSLKDIPSRRKNAECYREYLSDDLEFPAAAKHSNPAYLFFPVLGTVEIYEKLKNIGLPVSRVAFGNLEMNPAFSGYTFSNTEEKELQKKYFLLPLHFSLQTTQNIALKIQKILKKTY